MLQAFRTLAAQMPTGCATSCPTPGKWLQIALGCIHGFGAEVALLPDC